jgi:hypothetical protein
MLNRPCLAVHPATCHKDDRIELIQSFRSLERLLYQHAMGFVEKVLFEGLVINCKFSGSWSEENAGC